MKHADVFAFKASTYSFFLRKIRLIEKGRVDKKQTILTTDAELRIYNYFH